jgi:hypothetical protein
MNILQSELSIVKCFCLLLIVRTDHIKLCDRKLGISYALLGGSRSRSCCTLGWGCSKEPQSRRVKERGSIEALVDDL